MPGDGSCLEEQPLTSSLLFWLPARPLPPTRLQDGRQLDRNMDRPPFSDAPTLLDAYNGRLGDCMRDTAGEQLMFDGGGGKRTTANGLAPSGASQRVLEAFADVSFWRAGRCGADAGLGLLLNVCTACSQAAAC
jgi:hypothetical protein